uniref:Alpha-carbonic anhydrase domain-containing protein n=1 Tax=Sinocyclocheilus grahami TaxID=75366 RepID=A0A672RPH4_SINGR
MQMHIVSRRSDLKDSTAAKVQDGFAMMGFISRIYRVHPLEVSITISNDNLCRKYLLCVFCCLIFILLLGDKVRILEPFSMLLKGVDLSKYYHYNGSLTTPPCDEAGVWTIFKDPIRISKDLFYFNNLTRHSHVHSSSMLANGQTEMQLNKYLCFVLFHFKIIYFYLA